MCCGQHPSFERDRVNNDDHSALVLENLRDRLADTEARLARARAREAHLTRRLHEMKRFLSVMEILEDYLKRRYRLQQQRVARLLSLTPPTL
ncbi:protein SKIP34 [Cicer arietinum]|uniref:Protein SKIP34 n=1 Tax=Cicer arietinum TaxID=3827 RepID=A0A1S2YTK4_CICAR|nr:protein SKIP34 [Cicer arietinum]XP_027192136.1 protein SKIP34 [Cicer arietinum]XP_027192137.1 protein SKIP34 [Cicer arietinum]